MSDRDLTGAVWRKSTRSSANGDCVEVAKNLSGVVLVRDSKDPDGPALIFTPPQNGMHSSSAQKRESLTGKLISAPPGYRTGTSSRQPLAGRHAAAGRGAARAPGPYQVQAGIAALHALATSDEATNSADVRALYDRLYALDPSPIVLLNRAVATRFAVGPAAAALTEVDALRDRLVGYRLWHAVRADLLAALNRPAEALAAAERALELATNPAERELMARRIGDLGRSART